jgi:hypothetical protein
MNRYEYDKGNGYVEEGKWRTCSYYKLNKNCKTLVDDLISSSNYSQNWSEEVKHKYFTKAVAIAFDSGKQKSKLFIWKENIKDKLFCWASRFLIYVP